MVRHNDKPKGKSILTSFTDVLTAKLSKTYKTLTKNPSRLPFNRNKTLSRTKNGSKSSFTTVFNRSVDRLIDIDIAILDLNLRIIFKILRFLLHLIRKEKSGLGGNKK